MEDYVIFTDSCCDVSPELLAKWGVPYANMTFSFDGEDKQYIGTDISNHDFYDRMRQGAHARTAAINADTFARAFTPILEEGKDILYVAFSSGLSTTVNSAHMAAEELKEQHPDRKIVIVDTLAASAGGVLGIKPIMQMDEEGHLVKVSTARGRKKAIEALAEKYAELSYEEKNTPIFISHAEAENDAKQLADILKQRHGVEVTLITEIGPVIGSHAGPGTIALFFIGKHR